MSPACVFVCRPTAPRLTGTASGQNYGKGRASVGNDDIDHYLGPLTKECGRESIYMTAITSTDVHFFGYSMRTDSWRLTVWLPWDHVQVIGRWDKLVESQGVRGWVETCGCPKACQTHWEGNCSDPTAGIAALLCCCGSASADFGLTSLVAERRLERAIELYDLRNDTGRDFDHAGYQANVAYGAENAVVVATLMRTLEQAVGSWNG